MKKREDIFRLFRPSMRMYFVFLVIFVLAALFTGKFILAAAEAIVVALLAWYSGYSNKKRKRQVIDYIESAAYNLEGAPKGMFRDMPFPMVIFNTADGRILWSNEGFLAITGGRDHFFEIGIGDMVPGFKYHWLVEGKTSAPEYVRIGERIYNVYGNAVRMDEKTSGRAYWGVLYWLDVTDYVVMERKYKDTRPVVAVMMLDNYDELFKNVTETAKSAVLAALDSVVMEWTKDAGGYLSRYDRDRYIFIFEESYMPGILADKFAILDKVREIMGPGGIPATMSIGIGRGAANLEEGFQYALLGIDMALSRGGDQAVIKNNQNFEFYGGNSVAVERRTKVKSRVMANALRDLIMDSSNIMITGHKHADLDCIGSAVGLCCIARKLGKTAYVIINKDTNVAMPLVQRLKELPEYERTFISENDAMLIADGKTLLIVVDTNRPDQVEAFDLMISCNRVAVVDHHRRAAEYISNAALNFHEPYASSASELSTELLQYIVEPSDLLKTEAEAILSGIVLDTKNFTMRTGSRTFESAAFLRKAGSDTTEVKRLFQSDLPSTVAKYSIIRNARIYREGIAIAVTETKEDRIIAAQAADELLNISGIHTSFVIYTEDGGVNISARSIGDVNVQFVLEKLGGGGNRSMAGAQLKGKTIQEVLIELQGAIEAFVAGEETKQERE